MLPQDTKHLIQRPCYQRGSPCQDPACNWTTRRPPDNRKETQTAVCFPFIRPGPNHFARHSEMGKKTRQTEEEVGKQHQGMDRPGFRRVPEGIGEQGKMEKTGCRIICGAPTTLAVKGLTTITMTMTIRYWVHNLNCIRDVHYVCEWQPWQGIRPKSFQSLLASISQSKPNSLPERIIIQCSKEDRKWCILHIWFACDTYIGVKFVERLFKITLTL